jgi:hypothetical protein
MSHSRSGAADSLHCIEQLRLIYEQEKFFEMFRKLRETVTEFLNFLSTAREAYANGERDIRIEPNRFRSLVISCEEGLLLNVSEELRLPVRLEAEQSALNTELLPRSRTIKTIALVELRIRFLMVLVLELLSARHNGETRLPDWDREIADVQRELDASRRAWREACLAARNY